MKHISLATILITTVLILLQQPGSGMSAEQLSTLDPAGRAGRHAIAYDRPAVNFFEGGVLGNGGLGAVVTTRPDAVVIRFGHNDVWDIRLAEDNADEIGTFRELFDRVAAIPDTLDSLNEAAWYRNYLSLMRENYAKPYPRPFPCGSAVLWFDRRRAELLGHRVHIDRGVCEVDFLVDGVPATLEIVTDMEDDRLWLRMTGEGGRPAPSPFVYIALLPDPETPREFPEPAVLTDRERGIVSFTQVLPFEEEPETNPYRGHPRDRAFRLTARVRGPFLSETLIRAGEYTGLGIIPGEQPKREPKGILPREGPFRLSIGLDNGPASTIAAAPIDLPEPDDGRIDQAAAMSETIWRAYWNRSGVAIDDEFLERIWYRNLYFLRCSLRPGVTCPGLFANWSYRGIGTAWHGDYHMNYNTQQPFWATFSSNHPELHLPYVEMVENVLLPVSRKWAREYYGMRGAFFPHSAYPVEMSIMPYPLPTWGWEVFETPWSVQSLWWHYTYTMDEDFLRTRAFGPIREAVLFLVDYMKRPEARGDRWGDDNYHIFPSVPPELYGLKPGFDKNYDTTADLALTRFVFHAFLDACGVLGIERDETGLMADVRDILGHFPDYPTAESPIGEVFVSVPGENPEVVYNVPASLLTVFPGEHHGLHSDPDIYDTAANTYRNQQNEGGNDLVFLNLQAARLGLLDIEKFKRQIRYCLLPNGTCTDKVLQIHGRYTNNTPFDFMAPMGIWFENFALPAVIDECLLQSCNGELRFFPNWPKHTRAEFKTLRAAGAFLVSARCSGGRVEWIEIESEAGSDLTILSPWEEGMALTRADGGRRVLEGNRVTIETEKGEILHLRPAE